MTDLTEYDREIVAAAEKWEAGKRSTLATPQAVSLTKAVQAKQKGQVQ